MSDVYNGGGYARVRSKGYVGNLSTFPINFVVNLKCSENNKDFFKNQGGKRRKGRKEPRAGLSELALCRPAPPHQEAYSLLEHVSKTRQKTKSH